MEFTERPLPDNKHTQCGAENKTHVLVREAQWNLIVGELDWEEEK